MNIQEIYNRLKLADKEDCLIKLSDPTWKNKVSFPSRLLRLLEKNELLKTLDAFFCFDNKPLVLFFANCENKQALHKAIWNLNESPIVIIIENNAIEIYNGYNLNKETKLLERIGGADKLSDFDYFELVTGKTWEKYQNDLSHKNRVDYQLLNNIEVAQDMMFQHGVERTLANALIGKIIFYRYLIDRKVRLNYQGKEIWTNEDLCDCLKSIDTFRAFVQYLEQKFNGDMFRINHDDYQSINQDILNVLIRLLESEELKTGQRSLFNLYDFSILPIEFISNMYEKFIGIDRQDQESAYYTPTFLVDYIVSETVEKYLQNDDSIFNCRILDPSCGSGIFLVESLRRIIEKYMKVNNIVSSNTVEFKNGLKELVCDNIFGIDKDYDAVQVAIFSIYLTLLDYQEPADIENFKFPKLYGKNLICSDTFDVENNELKALEERKLQFQYIIGNPPWKGAGGDNFAKKYIKNRKQKEIDKKFSIGINNNELAEYFVFRVSDFCSQDTKISLIIHSTSLYNSSKDSISIFRNYLLEEFYINGITELACVRKEVFDQTSNDKSIAPACVLFYQYANGNNTDSNVITHISIKPSRFFSLFKIFSIYRTDIQKIQQNRLKEHDWLWKVLVYGSYLDYLLISRLKNQPSVKTYVNDSTRFVYATGVTFSETESKYDSSEWFGRPFIDTYAVNRFSLNQNKIELFDTLRLGRNRNSQQDIFQAPMLLIRHGLDIEQLTARAVVSFQDAIFKKSLLSIKAYNMDDINVLKNIACILSSDIMSYFAILTFSSIGIERENAKEYELLSIPYVNINDSHYDNLTALYSSYDQESNKSFINESIIGKIKTKINNEEKKLNENIKDSLGISCDERDLIDYALNISRIYIRINSMVNSATRIKFLQSSPLFKAIQKNDHLLIDYAEVYIERFADSFNRNKKRFVVEIYHSLQIIGMKFKIIDEKKYTNAIIVSPEHDKSLFAMAITLSPERITDNLFVQKDVRGFEKDFFYIFKPNERRLWHRAIAHLDVNEFDDAILKAGRNK